VLGVWFDNANLCRLAAATPNLAWQKTRNLWDLEHVDRRAFVAHRHEDLNIEYRARSDECRRARGPATGQREKQQRWPKSHMLLHSFILRHSLLDIRYSSAAQRSYSNDFEEFVLRP
jgi:hypothetical protein